MKQRATARKYHYTVLFERAGGGPFVASCPTLPGFVTEGDTLDEARARAAANMSSYLEHLDENGLPLPEGTHQPRRSIVIKETLTFEITTRRRRGRGAALSVWFGEQPAQHATCGSTNQSALGQGIPQLAPPLSAGYKGDGGRVRGDYTETKATAEPT